MASLTPMLDALQVILDHADDHGTYVSRSSNEICLDGWWSVDKLEEALNDVFTKKEF